MNVVLVALARRGGVVHFLAQMANSLRHVVSVTAVMSSEAPASYFDDRVTRRAVNTGRSALGSLARALNPGSWYRMWSHLASSRADIVHITGPHAWNPIVALLSKLSRLPLVYSLHDPEEHRGAPISIRFANWCVTRLADAIVVLTEHGKRQLVAKGFAEGRIHVIPHGVYSLFLRWRRRGARSRDVFLCFGRFEAYKGLENVVAAYGHLRGVLPKWRLVLAGNGTLPAKLKQDLPVGVEIKNAFIPDDEVAGLLQEARLVVVPYSEATQSGVIAAAYAFGRPVIATAVGGLPEMVIHGRTGLLISPDDARALARAMRSLATNPERIRRMGQHAYQMGRTTMAWERIARMHVGVYSAVLKRYGR